VSLRIRLRETLYKFFAGKEPPVAERGSALLRKGAGLGINPLGAANDLPFDLPRTQRLSLVAIVRGTWPCGKHRARAMEVQSGQVGVARRPVSPFCLESRGDTDSTNNEWSRQLVGWGGHWGDDDYVVLDQGRSVGRIYEEMHGDPRWCWSINTSPYPAPPPHNGVTKTRSKAGIQTRYEELKRMGVRSLS
jgi:hypothetical protein